MKFFAIVSAILVATVGVGAIAPDPDSACQCPNNCQHTFGASCAYYSDGNVIDGCKYSARTVPMKDGHSLLQPALTERMASLAQPDGLYSISSSQGSRALAGRHWLGI
ncbi:hypothetical protein BT96DRAFT_990594 [Gymnopus androsaceus JB14]|uniref:LRRNT domain-containing protein n=1 Tax=Gymnopus androsaceus JB14 TaxID=1447944 RepID=A0A6A4I1P3_9AGAR|nr:hypothetical protein BT96DRAFT_990594 [Gymnopus androsaceus JB14]